MQPGPGLKTDVENEIFALKQGQALEKRGAHPTENCQEYPPPRSVFISATIVIASSVKYWLSFFFSVIRFVY